MEVELDGEQIVASYDRLQFIMQKHQFDSRVLNTAVLKNTRALQEKASEMIERRDEVIKEHAEVWSEDEDVPDNAEVGTVKTRTVSSVGEVPVWKSDEDREMAKKKINTELSMRETFDLKTVPYEAMDTPEGETLAFWYPLEWMFVEE